MVRKQSLSQISASTYTCGQSVTGLSGTLISPNYPADYRNNEHCETEIAIPGAVYITLIVYDISVELCCDYLSVYTRNGTLLRQFTSEGVKVMFVYKDFVKVTFTTDGSSVRKGFSMDWEGAYTSCRHAAYDCDENAICTDSYDSSKCICNRDGYEIDGRNCTLSSYDCGQPVTGLSGNLTSPNYPDFFGNNENCETEIVIPGVVSITLRVDEFDVSYRSDYLRAYAQNGTLLRQFTTEETLVIKGGFAKVTFTTNGSGRGRRFRLHWQGESLDIRVTINPADTHHMTVMKTQFALTHWTPANVYATALVMELMGETAHPPRSSSSKFWKDIWEKETTRNTTANWLKRLKESHQHTVAQQGLTISKKDIKYKVQRMKNWAAPGHDMIQAFCMYNVHSALVAFIKMSMTKWKKELEDNGKKLASVKIKRGIYQGWRSSPDIYVAEQRKPNGQYRVANHGSPGVSAPNKAGVSCGPPPLIEKSDAQFTVITGTKYMDTANYTCLPEYEIGAGRNTITCQSNSSWTIPPTCDGISCGPPPLIEKSDAQATVITGTKYMDTANYTCLPGYEFRDGRNTIICQSNRSWTSSPTCDGVSCGPPPLIEKSDAQASVITGTKYMDTANYTCLPGYEFRDGRNTIICQNNRSWTSSPTCDGVSCGPPPLIEKSDAQATVITGTKYMDTANYTCLPGYEFRDGRNTIICQSNRSSTSSPTCDGVSCGPPPLIEKSDAQASVITGTKYMDTANYTCLPGYEFRDGRNTIICQNNRSWTSSPTCDGVSCGPPPLIEKSDAQATVITGTKYMDTANYTCFPGYEFRDRRDTITCKSNRSWTNPSTCDDCGNAPEVENGQPLNRYGNTTFGSIIAYMCITPEYQMLGSELVRCTEDGSWIRAVSTCLKMVLQGESKRDTERPLGGGGGPGVLLRENISCSLPPLIEKSDPLATVITGTKYMDTANYTCLPGYEIRGGRNTITCQSNSSWTNPPTCDAVDCGKLPKVENGLPLNHYGDTTFESIVTYTCIGPEYQMLGSELVRCTEDGSWSALPLCYTSAHTCGQSVTGLSGTLTSTNYPADYKNNEHCETEIAMPGAISITLTVDDIYLESCCDYLRVYTQNGTLLQQFTTQETIEVPGDFVKVAFTTDKSRVLKGFSMSWQGNYNSCRHETDECDVNAICTDPYDSNKCICYSNGYEMDESNCKRVSCGPPPLIEKSDAQATVITGTKYMDTVIYTCLSGYEIRAGREPTICQSNRTWTNPPTCNAVDCGKPPEVENGQPSSLYGNTTFGSILTYECIGLEYRMLGSEFVRCTEDGSWSALPLCYKVNCGPPPVVLNSERHESGHEHNDTVDYVCHDGYTMEGENTVSCQNTGYWTVPPECKAVDCGKPPEVENGQPSSLYGNTTFGSILTYECIGLEYRMLGSEFVQCTEDGSWSALPLCYKVNCGSPPVVLNSERYVSGHEHNDTVDYVCHDGYTMEGENSLRCQSTGYWTVPPECKAVDCGKPPEVENGQPSNLYGNTTFGSILTYECIGLEYRMLGPEFVRCTEDGSWSAPPLCYKVNCGPPPIVLNSKRQESGHEHNDTVDYVCHDGYTMEGENSVSCQSTGYWTVPPECKAVDCGKPPEVEKGQPSSLYGNTTFGSILTYECIGLEYRMLGSEFVRCTEDGSWSALPLCYKVNCGPPPVVLNSERHVSGHEHNDTADYVCHDGYTIEGENSVSCQNTGYWTVPPECKAVDCGNSPEVEKGQPSSLYGNTTFGSILIYECIGLEYHMLGSEFVRCTEDGSWSALPLCYKVNCGPPPVVLNSERHVSGQEHNDTVDYVCHEGYMKEGDNSISCQNTGHWTVPPYCKALSCDWPKIPENAELDFIAGTKLCQIASFQCFPGYTTDDSKHRTCQLNGEWSIAPNCAFDQKLKKVKSEGQSTLPINLVVLIICTSAVLSACIIIIMALLYLILRKRKRMDHNTTTVHNALYYPVVQEESTPSPKQQ
ncbi:sushi, von Willebrand factor type A, EGF and pentraxin domain-containing protein 1-like [Watersipora subatra]|uniref:sushi, von Willebrand factor type A, EGF and pentraxin domain-containing protein 1-like n=1 Tax=Watersipora subatra TaxID=2589382 RepID=UPI00355B5287